MIDSTFPWIVAATVGFSHAFEADHLLAVSNIVTRRPNTITAVKDGIFWGLGHSSTILGIGLLMIAAKIAISEDLFHGFEALVGLMLIGLGIHRIWKSQNLRRHQEDHEHLPPHDHRLAYGVGLIHGLAGSGALILLVMTQIPEKTGALLYLLIFGAGSIAGMLLASGIFSLPFSKTWVNHPPLRYGLTWLSALLCVIFGIKVIFENLLW